MVGGVNDYFRDGWGWVVWVEVRHKGGGARVGGGIASLCYVMYMCIMSYNAGYGLPFMGFAQ